MIRALTLAALAACLVAPKAQAQQSAGKAAVNDSLFAMAAADGGLSEVTIAELGTQKATDPELKRFSQQMIDEHTRMGQEMRSLLAQKGMRVPEMVDVRAQFCGDNLAGLSGADFDRCYAKAQCTAHMEAVEVFTAEAERGQDPEIKAWAARTLPHIKEHLAMIKPHAERAEKEKPSTPSGDKAHSGDNSR